MSRRHTGGGGGLPFAYVALGLIVGAATKNWASVVCSLLLLAALVLITVEKLRR